MPYVLPTLISISGPHQAMFSALLSRGEMPKIPSQGAILAKGEVYVTQGSDEYYAMWWCKGGGTEMAKFFRRPDVYKLYKSVPLYDWVFAQFSKPRGPTLPFIMFRGFVMYDDQLFAREDPAYFSCTPRFEIATVYSAYKSGFTATNQTLRKQPTYVVHAIAVPANTPFVHIGGDQYEVILPPGYFTYRGDADLTYDALGLRGVPFDSEKWPMDTAKWPQVVKVVLLDYEMKVPRPDTMPPPDNEVHTRSHPLITIAFGVLVVATLVVVALAVYHTWKAKAADSKPRPV